MATSCADRQRARPGVPSNASAMHAPTAAALHEVTHFLLLLGTQDVEEIGCDSNHFGAVCLKGGFASRSFLAAAWSS